MVYSHTIRARLSHRTRLRGRDRTPLTERLRREPVLRLAAESRGRALLDQYFADERIRPVSTIDVPSVSLLLSYVSGGLGIGLVPALALAEAQADRIVIADVYQPEKISKDQLLSVENVVSQINGFDREPRARVIGDAKNDRPGTHCDAGGRDRPRERPGKTSD